MDLITSARAMVETATRMTAWKNRLQACEAETSPRAGRAVRAPRIVPGTGRQWPAQDIWRLGM